MSSLLTSSTNDSTHKCELMKMVSTMPKPSSLLIVATFLFLYSSFFSSLGAAAPNGVVLIGRSVLEDGNSSSLVLAKERSHRKDPTDHFNYYNGGWNISNDHYISSVIYTGAPLFLIAAIWFIVFGIFLLLACMYTCCCRRRSYGYSRFAYALSLILLALFTIAAVVGSIVLYTGQGKFHETTKNTLNYVLDQANSTKQNLTNVSGFLAAAKNIGVDQVFLPQDVQRKIDSVDRLITSAADTLGNTTSRNKDRIFRYLNDVGLILIIVAAVMLGLAVLGFLLSILGLPFLVNILVIVGWILVAITFILCGVFLVLHNLMGDTCVAMNEWVRNPAAHTALDKIIPCVDPTTAQQALNQSKDVTFDMVNLVNVIIRNVSNINPPPNLGLPINYNQSGPSVPLLCNPYNPDGTNRSCVAGEVDLTNATQVWRGYECEANNNVCTTVGRLTPSLYGQMSSAVNVSYGLDHYGPFLSNLVDCTFVRDTLTAIYADHCPGLRKYSRWVYIGLAMVSSAVMLSLIFWVVYARERRHRKYTKLQDEGGR